MIFNLFWVDRSAGCPSDTWEVTDQKLQRFMSGRSTHLQIRMGGHYHRQEVGLDVTFNPCDLFLSAGPDLPKQLQLLQTVLLARKKSLKRTLQIPAIAVFLTRELFRVSCFTEKETEVKWEM